ncbi:MAG: ABC transporter [Desulfobacteraceae bacterium 4484_190.1]|nr:MAG: ABC transporter [Desulfobacteraceae bacterium 4484_190.1]
MIKKIGIIGRTYRHVQRYRQILMVLFKYGFGDVIDTLRIEQYLEIGLQMISRRRREKIETLSRAERVRMTLEELGPTFIKLGQILSTRPDLLPVEFIRELGKLQDDVPPYPFKQVKETIETEFGSPLNKLVNYFKETPLASASLGQVHRAQLSDGEEVVIKVQRPNIRKTVEVDMEIMLHMATLMEKHLIGWDIRRPTQIVEEFARTLEKELDYNIEAAHMERFAMQFTGESTVYVPKVYRELLSSRVLAMEYIKGIKPANIDILKKEGLDPKEIAVRGFDLIMKQIFVHGFFHADPHPGNIFILPNNVISYIDFGMMGRLNRENRENFADLIIAVIKKDEAKAVNALLRLATSDEEVNRHYLERDLIELIDQHFYRSLKELDLGALLHQLMNLMSKNRLHVSPDLFLMVKALGTVEGLGRILDPDFDAAEQAAPFVKRIRLDRIHPKRIAKDMTDAGTEFFHLLKEIPGEVREILNLARRGKIKMEFEHKGLEPLLSNHDRISNRIAFAIVLAAQIIGSSLIVLSDVPPKWFDIPIIGLLGFLFAGIMGFWLLITILKRGKM